MGRFREWFIVHEIWKLILAFFIGVIVACSIAIPIALSKQKNNEKLDQKETTQITVDDEGQDLSKNIIIRL